VVVTGGAGFLGRHVVNQLKWLGADVVALGRKDGDLRKSDTAKQLLRDADCVVHLAADVGGVGYLREHGCLFDTNIQIGINVIQAVCSGNASQLVIASSPCCYAADAPVPQAEEYLGTGSPAGDTAAYAFSKLASSAFAEKLCRAAGRGVVSFIPGNLYGPFDTFSVHRSHVVAALLRKALIASERGEPAFEVWGSGSATRDLVFVEDVATAVAKMALRKQPFSHGIYNLGSGNETTIRDLAQTIAKCVGSDIQPSFSPEKPVGYARRALQISRAVEELEYCPSTSLTDGILKTIHWVRESGMLAEILSEN